MPVAEWQNFQTLPELYKRVRIDNIQNVRKRNLETFQRRLQKFIDNTRNGIMYGEWHDDGRLLSD
ncbi:MAG: YdeI/OmpD-associated family protein [Alistipes sp.]|nr:YdeI/OmpD-associated family protein [Alistipes sp.]